MFGGLTRVTQNVLKLFNARLAKLLYAYVRSASNVSTFVL